jgi:hypothetical protein
MRTSVPDPDSVVKRVEDALRTLRGCLLTKTAAHLLTEMVWLEIPHVKREDIMELLWWPKIRGKLITDALIAERASQIGQAGWYLGIDFGAVPEVAIETVFAVLPSGRVSIVSSAVRP